MCRWVMTTTRISARVDALRAQLGGDVLAGLELRRAGRGRRGVPKFCCGSVAIEG